jgi:PAS domain S-box-containing protein/putative nucleotidyltransferase with HDIG domain
VLEGPRAEESALKSARENELLALAVRALVACSDESAVFDVIEEFFLSLTPDSIVLVNRTTPDREWVTVRSALGIEDSALSSATAVLGFNVVGSTWSIKEQDWDRFFAPVLTEVEGGLTQLIGAVVPKPAAAFVQRALGIHRVYAIGIADEQTALGSVCIFSRAPLGETLAHVIEAFIYPCFVTLERIATSGALEESAERHRLLFENMSEGLAVHEIVFDDEGTACDYRFVQANPAFERATGLKVAEVLGRTVLEITPDFSPEFIRRYAEVARSGIPRRDEDYSPGLQRHLEVVCYSPAPNQFATIVADITGRKATEDALAQREQRLEELLQERERNLALLSRTLTSTISVISQVVEMRDPYTAGHERRVAELATRIAEKLGMDPSEVDGIRVAGLMHDVGKVSIPAEILSKPGTLSKPEFELIKGHAEAGYLIIESANMEGPIAELVYQHHERCDGSGYPRGLTGEHLLPGTRVLMVADVVEAMISHRPYRPGLSVERALSEIRAGSGALYEPVVCDACIEVFETDGFTFSQT